jgi:Fe-S cluster biogenesis protein NfuA
VETRIEKALADVRPYLGSHGGDVELISVSDDGVCRLRMLGSCDGCPSSSVTLKLAVETAIEAAAPEIVAIEVEEPRTASVIPVAALFSRLAERDGQGASWVPVPELTGPVTRFADPVPIVVCRVGADLFAFRDDCARCGQSLAGASLTRRLGGAVGDAVLRCPECHAHYDVRRAGACLDDDTLHLAPLPLLTDGATVSVAVPAPVPT